MPKRDAKRVRKPAPLRSVPYLETRVTEHGWCHLIPTGTYLGAKTAILDESEARRLARFLLKFADWAEQEAKRGDS